MELLADENVEAEWIQALREDGHDVRRVVDAVDLSVSTPDADVLSVATRTDRVLVTAEQADFSDPPVADHGGIVIIADGTSSGGALRTAIRRIERSCPDPTGMVAYAGEWLSVPRPQAHRSTHRSTKLRRIASPVSPDFSG
jgi:hypothetical protein